eukprot:TRINITY_DN9590_c0_g1_i1.p1 TRINITY_DN9590_c0_g1~~TRINITY_DN9590_c0_g1_i1.p1  ORF type:complete len:312 (+),score=95.14 TRINITY_DN9590_c0_g1_i1:120-1055(+)
MAGPVCRDLPVSDADVATYRADGFIKFEEGLPAGVVDVLNARLERVLRGEYDTGAPPDKTPKLLKGERRGPLGFSGNTQNVKVLQLINVHHGDKAFREVVTSPALGAAVAKLAGWESGARVAQDQVWAKPPGSAPLVFHRDSPYFFFAPADVVTVWIALDDMEEELGPLEYVAGSHRWGDTRNGAANVFFSRTRGAMDLVHSAAAAEGLAPEDLRVASMRGLAAGGLSIHDGRTWHGSGANRSATRPRRGVGIHFIPGCAKFTPDATCSTLWKKYVLDEAGAFRPDLDDAVFPLTGPAVQAAAGPKHGGAE